MSPFSDPFSQNFHKQPLVQKQMGVVAAPIRKKSLVIAGPTATGKTALSIDIALRIGGEIVSADSMQVYEGMDIGTAKVTAKEMRGVPHHLISCKKIDQPSNVVEFVSEAEGVITNILARGKTPIIVGGTGFYLHSLIYGPPQGPPASLATREAISAEVEKIGLEAAYHKLFEIDPIYAKTISSGDKQKIVRAFEIISLTGKKVSEFEAFRQEGRGSPLSFSCFFIYYPKEILYERIDLRCDAMIRAGFAEEVDRLLAAGLQRNHTASQAIGYKQYLEYLSSPKEERDWQRFVDEFKRASRRYAKRQFTWFRKEPQFEWVNLDECEREELIGKMCRSVQ